MGRSSDRSSSGSSSSRSRSRSKSRGAQRRSGDDEDPPEGTRVHVGEITSSTTKEDLEDAFKVFGKLREVWMAQNPPCFGFIVFKRPQEAEKACREMNGATLCGGRIRVSIALPRARQRRQMRPFNQDMRCYQCGKPGHFSRDCRGIGRNRNRWSPPERRRRSRGRSSSRSRSYSRSYSRSRSRGDRGSGRRGGSGDRPRGSEGRGARRPRSSSGSPRRRDKRDSPKDRKSSPDRSTDRKLPRNDDRRSGGSRDRRREGNDYADGPTAAEILAANS